MGRPTGKQGISFKTGAQKNCKIHVLLTRKFNQGALEWTNRRGQTEPKRRFAQLFSDFWRFSPFRGKQSIWETQIFAENRWLSQETAENRRNTQEPRRLAFVPFPRDPDILKTVCTVNLLSVVNLLRVVIHYWKYSESLHFVLIFFVLSSESLCVVNSLQSSRNTTESDSVLNTVRKGPLG